MKSEIIPHLKVKLDLNEKEAIWLKSIMQNAINVKSLEDEDIRDRDMRMRFWNALEGVKLT